VKSWILMAAAVIPAYLMVGAVWVVFFPAWIRHRGWEWITKKGGMVMKSVSAVVGIAVVVSMVTGCGTLNRLGIPFTADKAKVGIRLILDREGYGDNLTDEEVSQLVDWVDQDWTQNQERQVFLDGIASRQENEETILALADKYYPGGEWNLPMKDVVTDAGPHIVTKIDTWYGGEDLSEAVVDSRFQLTVSRDGRTWSAAPSDWPMKDDLNVMVCAAYQNDAGEWVGGKYEWNRASPSPRSFSNIEEGYEGWVAPEDGHELIVWAASVDGKKVSTEATAIYN